VRPERLFVVADHTPGQHAADSDEIEWWLPVLGPTAAVLVHALAGRARREDHAWATVELARRIGLAGRRSALWTSLERLDHFRCVTFVAVDVLTVRLELPALTTKQVRLLPDDMATEYRSRHMRPA
jgi:hypothetical protein